MGPSGPEARIPSTFWQRKGFWYGTVAALCARVHHYYRGGF